MNNRTKTLQKRITDILALYFKTQFVVIIIVTLVSWVILSILGIKYALVLACITGVFSTIPTFGVFTSAVITALVAIFDNVRFIPNIVEGLEGVAIIAIYILLNFLIDWGLTPYLTGKIVKIHPLVLFISVLIGSAMFGIVGAFLATPLLLVAKTSWEFSKEKGH